MCHNNIMLYNRHRSSVLKIIKKITLFCTVALTVLFVLCISVSAEDIIFMGAWDYQSLDVVVYPEMPVMSGYLNGSSVTYYGNDNYHTGGTLIYSFSFPTVALGDIYTFKGVIAVPTSCTLIEFVYLDGYSTNVTFLGNSVISDGTIGQSCKFYSFSIIGQVTSLPVPYSNFNIQLTRGSDNRDFLFVSSMEASLNGDASFVMKQQTNETFGYSAPNSGTTSSGLTAGSSLLDSLTSNIDGFNAQVNTSVSGLLDSITSYKTIVHSVYDVIPSVLQYLIVFAIVFLVLRKVVGR